ncbi:hypothetical protein PIROE2DRAFT_1738 [Piromyces sp. E2]|nr:hypothetical protein PIROE2DRAFT_1738 [Piromyces sp. E2]|eukprot:OUM70064.1 hypothetical protein PIROE2DRAFT_1738 [Piromyces sp. E2]
MKYFNLIFFLSAVLLLFLGKSQAMTCDEAKDLLSIEYEGNCCDLPQIQCNEANDQVLSVKEIFNDVNNLERRRTGTRYSNNSQLNAGYNSNSTSSSVSIYSNQKYSVFYSVLVCSTLLLLLLIL